MCVSESSRACKHPLTASSLIFVHALAAETLLIAGAHRHAFRQASTCQSAYSASDAAHDTGTLFHRISSRIIHWQLIEQGGCEQDCAFLQLHGKGSSSCPDDTVFLSAGTSTAGFYESSTDPRNRIINKIASELAMQTGWTVSTPANSTCFLVASTNVQVGCCHK